MTSKKELRKQIRAITAEADRATARVTLLETYARRVLIHLKDVDHQTAPGLWRDVWSLEGLVERIDRPTPGYTLSELLALRNKLAACLSEDWTDDLPDTASELAKAAAKPQRYKRTRHDMFEGGGSVKPYPKFGEPGTYTINDEAA